MMGSREPQMTLYHTERFMQVKSLRAPNSKFVRYSLHNYPVVRNAIELIRLFREVGFNRFLQIARLNRDVTPLVKGFALTQVIGSLQQLGFFEVLQRAPAEAEALAHTLRLRIDVLAPVLEYLYGAGILEKHEAQWALSTRGRFITLQPHGLFLLYRAYGAIFFHLDRMLKGEVEYGSEILRDEPWMATGSSQIIRWLPIPVVMNWIDELQCKSLLDIGCGAGDFLGEVIKTGRFVRVVGVDRSPEIIKLAAARNPGSKMVSIEYHVVDAMIPADLERLKVQVPKIDAVSIMFVLHELVYVSPETARLFLSNLRAAYPSARVFVCELVAPSLEERANAGSGNELLYHSLSHQRPLPLHDWLRLFSDAGYRVEKMKTFEMMAQAYFTLIPN
jgi:ubiquinone/menaquinone biosynthesis C-methylase UbiE